MADSQRYKATWTALVLAVAFLILGNTPANAQEKSQATFKVPAPTAQNKRSNIVLLNLDDADVRMMSLEKLEAHYPCFDRIAKRATHFTNVHCTTPFCGPSRAALFTGQYAFSNRCLTNGVKSSLQNGFAGGYGKFKDQGHHEHELGVWLQKTGYRTIQIGKYHHAGFDFKALTGWDDYSVTNGNRYMGTTIFSNIGKSEPARFRNAKDKYIAQHDLEYASLALNDHFKARPDSPFFLYIAPLAPHSPPKSMPPSAMVEPKYRDYANGLEIPKSEPDYNENDMSDKPAHLQRKPLFKDEVEMLEETYISRLRAVKSVDDMLEGTLKVIEDAGKLDNTIIMITSDNGFALGHHRLNGKNDPYDRSTNVPLMIAMPSSSEAKFGNHLIAQLDLCPTILELVGAEIPSSVDGKSFASLIDNPSSHVERTWQRSIMIENWTDKRSRWHFWPMSYTAERYFDSIYIGWHNGASEYYDLKNDSYQLENRFPSLDSATQKQLKLSLLNFRKDTKPKLSITSPIAGEDVSNRIRFEGLADDNSATLFSKLTIRSYFTGRFYDGEQWHDEPTHIWVPVDSMQSNISSWSSEFDVYTEIAWDLDCLICNAQAFDDDGLLGESDYSFNKIEGMSLFAKFNPRIDGRIYPVDKPIRISGYKGEFPNSQVKIAIFRQSDGKYFNGTGFQSTYTSIACDVLPNHRWEKTIDLPKGRYRVFLRSWVPSKTIFQRDPSIINFKVQ